MLAAKRRLFERYRDAFARVDGVKLFAEPENCRSNYWLQTLLLDNAFEHRRDDILEATNRVGQVTRPVWNLLPSLSPYQACQCAPLPVAKSLERRAVNIPSSAFLAK